MILSIIAASQLIYNEKWRAIQEFSPKPPYTRPRVYLHIFNSSNYLLSEFEDFEECFLECLEDYTVERKGPIDPPG